MRYSLNLVDSGGFEPPKASKPSDLQSDPVGRLGNYPKIWWVVVESNHGHSELQPDALTN